MMERYCAILSEASSMEDATYFMARVSATVKGYRKTYFEIPTRCTREDMNKRMWL
jgi:hypothetical protein